MIYHQFLTKYTLQEAHPKADTGFSQIQLYIAQLETWLLANRLTVESVKSTSKLLTNCMKEHSHKPTVILNNIVIQDSHCKKKILGVTYYTSLYFQPHVDNKIKTCRPRLTALRTLSSTTFGHNKESLTLVYKQYICQISQF